MVGEERSRGGCSDRIREDRGGETYDDFVGIEGVMVAGSRDLVHGAVVVYRRGFEVIEGAVLLH